MVYFYKNLSLVDREKLVRTRIETLEDKRRSIVYFVKRCNHYDPTIRRYVIPAFIDLEEISCHLKRYRGKLDVIRNEIREEEERSWDWRVMDKIYDS